MMMTKEQLQKELKEKVKEGVKPSDIKRLKRSKSADDITQIPTAPPLPNQSCPYCPPLKLQTSELKDSILQLRIDRLKDFSDYQEEVKGLSGELKDNANYGTKEIERLETKLKNINKKRLELQDQLSQTQSKNARLELKLIEEQNKDTPLAPTPNS
jgi:chromosome segregation ATPase